MAVDLGTAVGYLELDYTKFKKALDTAVSDATAMSTKLSSTLGDGFTTIGGKITSAGKTLTAGVTAPLAGALISSVKFGSEFDKQMSAVKAVTGATGDEFETLRETAITWGEKTVYSAKEVADAMYYMGLAGWKTDEVYSQVGNVLNLAAAGNLDLARTSDIVTDAMTALNVETEDTDKFVNALAATMTHSNTDVEMLGESFKYAASIAGSSKFDYHDLAVALGLFANNGVKASQAGTGFRQALNALLNPSEKAEFQMQKYGVSLDAGNGKTKSLMTVMEQLRATFGNVDVNAGEVADVIEGLNVDLETEEGQIEAANAVWAKYGHMLPTTDMEKMTALVKIFGVRALPGMLSVINSSEDDFETLVEAIYGADSSFVAFNGTIYSFKDAYEQFGDEIYNNPAFEFLGEAEGIAATQTDNLQGSFIRLDSALGTSKIRINDLISQDLGDFVDKITTLISRFNNLDESQQRTILKNALIVGSIGPVLIIFGSLVSGIGKVITGFNEISGALTKVKSGFALWAESAGLPVAGLVAIIAVIAVLVAAFVNLWKNNEDFRNKMTAIWDGIKSKFEEAGQKITDAVNKIIDAFLGPEYEVKNFGEVMGIVIEGLTSLWNGFCDLLAPVFEAAFSIIGDVVGGIVDVVVGIIETITGLISAFKDGDWSMVWQGLSDIASGIMGTLVNVLLDILDIIPGIISAILKWFGVDWSFSLKDSLNLSGTASAAKSSISDMRRFARDNPIVLSAIDNTGIDTVFDNMVRASDAYSVRNVGINSRDVGSNARAGGGSGGSGGSGGGGGSIFESIYNAVVEAVEGIGEYLSSIPGKVAKFFNGIWDTVKTWAKNMVAKAKETGKNFLDNVVNFFKQLPGKVKEFVSSAWENIKKWATDMVNKAKEMAKQFLDNIVSFFQQLPGKIQGFITSAWEHIKKWATDMVNKAKEMAQNFLNNIVSFFQQIPGKIHEFIESAKQKVIQWAAEMIAKAQYMVHEFLAKIEELKELAGKIKAKLDEAVEKAKQWVTDMGNKGKEAASELIDRFLDAARDVKDKVMSIGENIVDGVWAGIQRAKEMFFSKIRDFFSGMVKDAEDELGIESPSKVMRDRIGRWLPPGVLVGFEQAMPALIKGMLSGMNKGIDEVSDGMEEIDAPATNLGDAFQEAFEGMVIWYESLEERLTDAVKGLVKQFKYLIGMEKTISGPKIDVESVYGVKKESKTSDKEKTSEGKNSGGGDTFVFYSNDSIDEVEAARLLRQTKRDLAEGF